MSRFPTALIVALLLAGAVLACATTRAGRLYDLNTGAVIQGWFEYSGTGRGEVWFGGTAAESSPCRGEYVTVPEGDVGWGTIYGGGSAATATANTMSAAQRGRAVATCGNGKIYECEYIVSAYSGAGSGSCQDNHGGRYRLMF